MPSYDDSIWEIFTLKIVNRAITQSQEYTTQFFQKKKGMYCLLHIKFAVKNKSLLQDKNHARKHKNKGKTLCSEFVESSRVELKDLSRHVDMSPIRWQLGVGRNNNK
jgi:hypothetical protein